MFGDLQEYLEAYHQLVIVPDKLKAASGPIVPRCAKTGSTNTAIESNGWAGSITALEKALDESEIVCGNLISSGRISIWIPFRSGLVIRQT